MEGSEREPEGVWLISVALNWERLRCNGHLDDPVHGLLVLQVKKTECLCR